MGLIQYFKDKIGAGGQQGGEQQNPNPTDNSFMPFKTKEEAVKFVKDDFEKRRKMKRDYELRWMLNINFLNNNQYCDINLTSQSIYQQDKAYEYQEMEVYNQIASIYETRLSKLKRFKPIPYVRPASNETHDISAAKTSKAILRGLDTNLEMSSRRSLVTAWSELTGCCFIKRRWDIKSGSYIGEDETGQIYEGDIEKDIVNSFEIFPDSNFASGVEGCKSIIHARPMTVEDIWEQWDVTIPGRKVDVFTISQGNIGGGLGYSTTNHKVAMTTVENSEIVIELMLLPCRRYPQGLNIIVAGNELLHIGPYIYRTGKNGKPGFPFEMQICIENPGFFWPTAILERTIPIQRAYNAVKNRKHEILNRKAIGNLAVEDDGNVDLDELEAEGLYPGKIHLYQRGGHAPQFLTNNESAVDFDTELKILQEEFAMISGVSPFSSQSLPPSGVVSGDAMEMLDESDNSRISLTKDNIYTAAIQGWKLDLRMYKQFVPQSSPRLLRYVGDNNEIDLIEWYASDLTSDDVIIDNEDEISQTPAQRMQIIKELLQYKLFSNDVDPKTRNKVIEMMKLGNWESTADIEELHVNKARRENKLIVKGEMPVFKDYDIHDLHIQEHNRFRLDIAYESFERDNPQLAQTFDMHVKQHEQVVQANAQAMAEQMNPKKGPAQSIPFKDLPVVGKIQQAEQAGIVITPEDLIQQMAIDQKTKEKQQNEATKQAS